MIIISNTGFKTFHRLFSLYQESIWCFWLSSLLITSSMRFTSSEGKWARNPVVTVWVPPASSWNLADEGDVLSPGLCIHDRRSRGFLKPLLSCAGLLPWRWSRWRVPPIGSLSSDVFERRTSTGSEVFSLLTCLDDIKFVFLSFFTVIEAIWLKICAKPPSKFEKRPLPVDVRRSKTSLLKVPTIRLSPLQRFDGTFVWKK